MPDPGVYLVPVSAADLAVISMQCDHLASDDHTTVKEYLDCVRWFLRTGDDTDLISFYGVTVSGYLLETDPETLSDLALRGALGD